MGNKGGLFSGWSDAGYVDTRTQASLLLFVNVCERVNSMGIGRMVWEGPVASIT